MSDYFLIGHLDEMLFEQRELESKAYAEYEKRYREFSYGFDHPEIQHMRLWHCAHCREPIDFDYFSAYQCCNICLMSKRPERYINYRAFVLAGSQKKKEVENE